MKTLPDRGEHKAGKKKLITSPGPCDFAGNFFANRDIDSAGVSDPDQDNWINIFPSLK